MPKGEMRKNRKPAGEQSGRREVCYNMKCSKRHRCGRYLPEDLESRRCFFKPGELVSMRAFTLASDSKCKHILEK